MLLYYSNCMLLKIDRQKAIDKFPNLPLRYYNSKDDEEVFNYPKVFANYVLTLPTKSYKAHIKLLGTQLTSLIKGLGGQHLIFLGDENTSWLKRLDTYDKFQQSLQYFAENKIGKRFNGALQVEIPEMPAFIEHLAWLVRTNGILPYVHFIDPGQNIIGNICQYGNLHISTKTKRTDRNLKDVIVKSRFTYLTNINCSNKFSKSGAIKDRTITV